MEIVTLTSDRMTSDMLSDFWHCQSITKTWIQRDRQWSITDTSVLRQWSSQKRAWIPQYLRQQTERGGVVVAAMEADAIIGFCSIDGICPEKQQNMQI